MKFWIVTYGCQMNVADSDLVSALLRRAGWRESPSLEEADFVLLNTCSVREKPEQKVYSRLGELRRWKDAHPDRIIAVAGCMAQREGQHLVARAPHVDLVIGTRGFHRIGELVERARAGDRPLLHLDLDADPSSARCRESPSEAEAPLRAFIPIIRGCTNFCTYCIVPYVRGPEISRPPADVHQEVLTLVRRGAREVTLLGQNVLSYGRDLDDSAAFPSLLRDLAQIPDLWRIRFTTCHPRDVTPAIIAAMADLPAVCEHIHLPVQAGADRVLREMHRGYTTAHYRETVEGLRAQVPGIAITTDIMVGFPGETEDEFEESLRFYQQIGFDAAFTFAYSPRPGTAAAERTDQIPRSTRLARLSKLIDIQNRITLARNQAGVGEEAQVLVDGPARRGDGLLSARTRTNKQVILPGPLDLLGSLATVHLTQAHLWGFRGQLSPR